jgi:sugar lactone lactonase YvrE
MKTKATITITTLVTLAVANSALAHPGSGIAVDRDGQVYFTQTNGKGTWKVNPKGELTLISDVRDHWLDIDLEGRFSRSHLKGFERITPDGARPTILLNGAYPFTVNRDGNIYSAVWKPGRLEINRQSLDGKVSAIQIDGATNAPIGGITGMASGPDGSLFVTDGCMLLKVLLPGRVATLVAKIVVSDCLDDLPAPHLRGVPAGPFLRGLAVDSEGAVYAAANRCRAVLKITPDGKVATILRATAPWSPTGVAVADGVVYVEEYDFPEAGPRQYEQRPRVRAIARDGKVTTLAIVGEK